MQSVVVDIPQKVLLKLLELNTAEIPDEVLPGYMVEVIENCLTTINQVRLALAPHGLDADTYFKAKVYASPITDISVASKDDPRCAMRVFFSQNVRANVVKYQVIQIIHAKNVWIADLLWAMGDAICGKAIYGFSEETLLNMNIARQRIGLSPLEV